MYELKTSTCTGAQWQLCSAFASIIIVVVRRRRHRRHRHPPPPPPHHHHVLYLLQTKRSKQRAVMEVKLVKVEHKMETLKNKRMARNAVNALEFTSVSMSLNRALAG